MEFQALRDDRSFGWGATAFGVLVLGLSAWRGWFPVRPWLWVPVASVLVNLFLPPLWRPLRVGWKQFGRGLGFVNSRIILSLAYLLLFVPLGALLRLTGRAPIPLRPDPKLSSYWTARPPLSREPLRYLKPH